MQPIIDYVSIHPLLGALGLALGALAIFAFLKQLLRLALFTALGLSAFLVYVHFTGKDFQREMSDWQKSITEQRTERMKPADEQTPKTSLSLQETAQALKQRGELLEHQADDLRQSFNNWRTIGERLSEVFSMNLSKPTSEQSRDTQQSNAAQ